MTDMEQIKFRKRKKSPFEPAGASGSVYVLLHDVVMVLAAITFIFVFFFRLVGVSGRSMNQTLIGGNEATRSMGDYLILESNLLDHSYARGDVVVACVPTFEDGKPIVKRVIATSGETISFRKEGNAVRVYINGERLEENYIKGVMLENGIGVDGASYTIPEGCYFLMGDNRNNSSDSRYEKIGFVDERYIVGRAKWIMFPGEDMDNDNKRDWSRVGEIPQ